MSLFTYCVEYFQINKEIDEISKDIKSKESEINTFKDRGLEQNEKVAATMDILQKRVAMEVSKKEIYEAEVNQMEDYISAIESGIRVSRITTLRCSFYPIEATEKKTKYLI